jgi:hypothetical protein
MFSSGQNGARKPPSVSAEGLSAFEALFLDRLADNLGSPEVGGVGKQSDLGGRALRSVLAEQKRFHGT